MRPLFLALWRAARVAIGDLEEEKGEREREREREIGAGCNGNKGRGGGALLWQLGRNFTSLVSSLQD